MYLLDTNICIYIINHKPIQVFEKFSKIDIRQVAISNISVAELAFGVQKSDSPRNKLALEKFLSPLTILEYPNHAIWHYAKLRHDLQSKGKVIGGLDMLIASHAIALNATLITNNVKEFKRIPELLLENWV